MRFSNLPKESFLKWEFSSSFRTTLCAIGGTTAPLWRNSEWDSQHTVALSVWHLQILVLEPQLVDLLQLEPTLARLDSGLTMRWELWSHFVQNNGKYSLKVSFEHSQYPNTVKQYFNICIDLWIPRGNNTPVDWGPEGALCHKERRMGWIWHKGELRN